MVRLFSAFIVWSLLVQTGWLTWEMTDKLAVQTPKQMFLVRLKIERLGWKPCCIGYSQRKRREKSKGHQEDRTKMNWQRKRYKSCRGPQSVAAVKQHSLFTAPSWWEYHRPVKSPHTTRPTEMSVLPIYSLWLQEEMTRKCGLLDLLTSVCRKKINRILLACRQTAGIDDF